MKEDKKLIRWRDFMETGQVPKDMNPYVAASWKKCRESGLAKDVGFGVNCSDEVLASIINENEQLISIALPILKLVYELIKDSNFLINLTDSFGYILLCLAGGKVGIDSKKQNFVVGALWSDTAVGTNAISVALDYDTSIHMKGADHYCESHHAWNCASSPVHGVSGEIIGCVNMSGKIEDTNPHTLALVKAAAISIENELRHMSESQLMQSILDITDTSSFILNESFQIKWMNKTAQDLLDLREAAYSDFCFTDLISSLDWKMISAMKVGDIHNSCNEIVSVNEKVYYSCVQITVVKPVKNDIKNYCLTISNQENILVSANKLFGNLSTIKFEDIVAKSDSMKRTVSLAKKFAYYDGTILIEGEKGVGKSDLAQAIHGESNRAYGPFIELDCASLNRMSFPNELLGNDKTENGIVTQEGRAGYFELARTGTLLFKNIDELPLEFQYMLTRIIENRRFSRLNSSHIRTVDVRIIASSTSSLQKKIATGDFDKELYMKLNVLRLQVPSLRERVADIRCYADKILDSFNERYPSHKKTLSNNFYLAIEKHRWSGNIIELENVIEKLFYTVEGSEIRAGDFQTYLYNEANILTLGAGGQSELESNLSYELNAETKNIIAALSKTNGSVEKAAAIVGMSRASIYRRIRR